MLAAVNGKTVFGQTVDSQTRCVHWATVKDVIAIRFRCCDRYYPCFECHRQDADHPADRWPESEWGTPAILCGVCRSELTIDEYRSVSGCPNCAAEFNENCALHAHLYFEV
jgi:uncharacterized CHY-type Zn-finger protein